MNLCVIVITRIRIFSTYFCFLNRFLIDCLHYLLHTFISIPFFTIFHIEHWHSFVGLFVVWFFCQTRLKCWFSSFRYSIFNGCFFCFLFLDSISKPYSPNTFFILGILFRFFLLNSNHEFCLVFFLVFFLVEFFSILCIVHFFYTFSKFAAEFLGTSRQILGSIWIVYTLRLCVDVCLCLLIFLLFFIVFNCPQEYVWWMDKCEMYLLKNVHSVFVWNLNFSRCGPFGSY